MWCSHFCITLNYNYVFMFSKPYYLITQWASKIYCPFPSISLQPQHHFNCQKVYLKNYAIIIFNTEFIFDEFPTNFTRFCLLVSIKVRRKKYSRMRISADVCFYFILYRKFLSYVQVFIYNRGGVSTQHSIQTCWNHTILLQVQGNKDLKIQRKYILHNQNVGLNFTVKEKKMQTKHIRTQTHLFGFYYILLSSWHRVTWRGHTTGYTP